MKITKLSDYVRGYFIGDFEPSVFRTKDFEVAVLLHPKGEQWPVHYHEKCVEYNVLLEGRMAIQGVELNAGDVFVLQKGEIADPVFYEDCRIVCVKVPSMPLDKIEIKDK